MPVNEHEVGLALSEITRGLAAATILIQSLSNEMRTYIATVTETKVQLLAVQDALRHMSKMLIEGNGHSLPTKVALSQNDIDDLKEWRIQREQQDKTDSQLADKRQWQMRVALVSTLISGVISIGLFILSIVMHGNK